MTTAVIQVRGNVGFALGDFAVAITNVHTGQTNVPPLAFISHELAQEVVDAIVRANPNEYTDDLSVLWGKGDLMTDIDGYEPNDPCSPGYHDRMADWQSDYCDGPADAAWFKARRERHAQEDAWKRESDDVARTVALVNLRSHGTIDAAPPELTTCPSCGTHVHPIEKTVGGITYFNCRRCDFSTWEWPEWIAHEQKKPATDEEIDRSFDAYR